MQSSPLTHAPDPGQVLFALDREAPADPSAYLDRIVAAARDGLGGADAALWLVDGSRAAGSGEAAPDFAALASTGVVREAERLSAGVWSAGVLLGALVAGRARGPEDEWLLRALANRAATAFERARRVAAEEALQSGLAQLTEAQRIAGLGSWEWDIPADRIRWSDEQFRLHGREPLPEVTFDWFFNHVHGDDRAWMSEVMDRAIREGGAFDFEYRIVRASDGEERWLRARGRVELDANGHPARMVGTSEDIHDARAALEALRESESRFRDLFEQFPASVQIFAPDGRTLAVNPAYRRLWGYGAEALGAFNPLTEPQLEPIRPLLRRGFAGETVELPAVRFDPSAIPMVGRVAGNDPLWVSASMFPLRDAAGRVRELVTVHQDVTAERYAADALRGSEENYRTIFERSNDAIFILDPASAQILDANRRACEMCASTLEELRADAASVIWNGPAPYTPRVAREQLARAAEGEVQRFEWMSIHPRTGEAIWGEVSVQRVVLGGAVRVMALVRDIAERKRAEQALRESEESYRAIFDASSDAIFVQDLETGAILEANEAACRVHGYTLEELRERGMEMIGNGPEPFTPDRAMEHIRRAATGEPQRFEWCSYHLQTGEEMWVEVSLQRVAIRGVDRLLAMVRDIRARKQAEAALRASEENYRTIFDRAGAAIWVHDVETGAFLDVNQGACDLYGFSVEEQKAMGVEGISWGESPYTIEDASKRIQRALAGEPQTFEWLGRHKNGGPVWAEVTLRRVPVSGVDRLLATARDINDRKRAEAALLRANEELERRVAERTAQIAEQKEFFEKVLGGLDAGIAVFDPEGRFQYASEKSIPTPELRAWVIGRTIPEYGARMGIRDEIIRLRYEGIVGAASSGQSTEFEEELPARDGKPPVHVLRRCVPMFDADGRVHRVVGYSINITERKQAEEAVRRSEEYFRTLIENGSDYLMIVDAAGSIGYVGPSVEHILGYTPEEILGKRPADLVHPDDLPQVMAVLQDLVEHPGTMRSVEFRILHKDGSWRVMENVGKTLSPDTADSGIVSNGRDVTDRRRAEQALRRATEEAERANRAKSEFLSRMSHELRTPMNSILGFAQLLARAELAGEHQKGVQHILKAGRHLLNLINEVLEISRIEAGRQTLSLEPVQVGTVVREALGLVRPLASQWGVSLEEEVPATVADRYVQADRQRLAQVLLNLLSNAIKYNRRSGVVRIGAEAGERVLSLRVSDTGPGIAPDRLDQLFTPFARLGAEQGDVEGTGLGLALSQRLAEAMGGALTLEASSAAGSVFRVDLGVAADPLSVLEPDGAVAAAGVPAHRTATLLYVEDNLANLALVESILLARPGWRVIPALQGQLGVELAREHRPDLVLLDLHLPDIAGEEVLRRLRADRRTAATPVVVVSADATPAMVERLLGAGADAYLTKPLDIDDFLAAVDRFLDPGA